MSKNADIFCNDLVVEFPLFDGATRSLKAQLGGANGRARNFRGLDGVTVEIEKGERVGLIGRNGAGKSTFLRTLAGVYAPKSGSLQVNSHVTSLFDVGVGLDQNASGYENIPLLMATRGIPLLRIDEVRSDVEEFTELGDALARPLRTYSAGMRLRIAFAVATFDVEGVLLMDEVVGVGDQQFAEKSKARVQNVMGQAGSVILASHVSTLLKTHCQRGLVFERGKIVFDGDIDEALRYS